MDNVLIPADMYKTLSRTTPLNDTLKQLFSEVDSLEQYHYLASAIIDIRSELITQQNKMVENVRGGELANLPLYIIRDKASPSGGVFLRWRSFLSAGNGTLAWKPILSDARVPRSVRKKLVSAEKERILVNVQVSVLNFMLRQVREAGEKIAELEAFFNEHSL